MPIAAAVSERQRAGIGQIWMVKHRGESLTSQPVTISSLASSTWQGDGDGSNASSTRRAFLHRNVRAQVTRRPERPRTSPRRRSGETLRLVSSGQSAVVAERPVETLGDHTVRQSGRSLSRDHRARRPGRLRHRTRRRVRRDHALPRCRDHVGSDGRPNPRSPVGRRIGALPCLVPRPASRPSRVVRLGQRDLVTTSPSAPRRCDRRQPRASGTGARRAHRW